MGKMDRVWGFQKKIGHNGNGNGRFVKADLAKVAIALVLGTGVEIPEFSLGIPARVLENKIGKNIVLGGNGDLRYAVPEAKMVSSAIQVVRENLVKTFDRKPGTRVRERATGKVSPMTAKRYDFLLANCDATLQRIMPLMILHG